MNKIVKRTISMLLCLAMVIGFIPATLLTGSAATVGTKVDSDTGLDDGSFRTEDYIALPIEIYDYKADGMLFQYAEPHINGTYTIVNPPEIDLGWDFSDTSIKLPSGTGSGGVAVNTNFTISYQQEGNRTPYLHAVRGSKGSNGEYIHLTLGNLGGVKASEMRYMSIRYRIQSGYMNSVGVYLYERDSLSNQPYIICDYDSGMSMTSGSWQTTVIDLAANTSDDDQAKVWSEDWLIDYVSMQPVAAGGYVDIAYVAFFGDKTEAQTFNNQAVRTYTLDDNLAFGLLGSSRTYMGDDDAYVSFRRISQTYNTVDTSKHGDGSWFESNTYTPTAKGELYNPDGISSIWQVNSSRVPNGKISGTKAELGYDLIAEVGSTSVTIGMLNPTLGANSNPVYKEETVYYLANLLMATLPISETRSNGTYNYDYVMGEKYDYAGDGKKEDLAYLLRRQITVTDKVGDYAETAKKKLIGTWEETFGNIRTYMDAAYFLLNNIFVAGSYNIPDDTHHHLILNSAKVDGKKVYVFDAGFGDSSLASSVTYKDGMISNSVADSKPMGYYSTSEATTYYPFLPFAASKYEELQGMTQTPYLVDNAAWNPNNGFNTYVNRNYNYVLRSHGEFTYREADDLFFEFEGDDDVYLFINGQLVLDIGGAHPIATQKINLNDYVDAAIANINAGTATERDHALALVDGESYDFDFFYMERHGYGANMRIVTNMKIVDTDIDVEKDAYQDGYELPDNAAIDINKPVEFSFTLINKGNENTSADSYLHSLVFTDPKIGVTISHDKGLVLDPNSRAVNSKGEKLTFKDLTFIRSTINGIITGGKSYEYSFTDENEFLAFLKKPENTGLLKNYTLEVRGIYVNMTEADFVKGPWVNTVTVDAISNTGTALRDTADVTLNNVHQPVYYMWAGHKLTVSADMLVTDINEAIDKGALGGLLTTKLASINSVALTSSNGVPVTNEFVSISDGIVTVSYAAPGAYLDHVQISFTDVNNKTGTVILPIQTYVVDVEDEVFVLDYGLPVDLSAGGALTPNDTLTVPGQDTSWLLESIANNAPTYLHGIDGNRLLFDSTNGGTYNGTYNLAMRWSDDNYALAVKDSSLENGTALCIWTLASSGNEANFTFHKVATVSGVDYYTIKSSATNKYLTQVGSAIELHDYTGENAQLWAITPEGTSGYVHIQCYAHKSAGTAKDLAALNAENGGTMFFHTMADDNHGGQWKLIPVNGNSGEFSFDKSSQKLVYSPAEFMEDAETVYLALRVHESAFNPSSIGATDINHEVEMFKAITVIPANVVYYEDDFPAIKYYKNDALWTGDIETDGSSGNLWQSNDQDEQYGHDTAYESGGVPVSGNSVTVVTIDEKTTLTSTPAASFSFAGTGFELVGRTNASDAATIVIKVKDASGKQIKLIPVITEFDHDAETEGNTQNEAIYQVPVIKVDNLAFGTYTVEIHGVASAIRDENGKATGEYSTTRLYIDGIRIYNPLGGGNVTGLEGEYIGSEQGATFAELRDLIITAEAGVVEWSDSMTVSTGISTYTENRIGQGWEEAEYVGNVVSNPEDYLLLGPNNEVYLNGISSKQAIVLYVKETDASIATLQIGVHLVDNLAFFGGDVTGTATIGKISLGALDDSKNLTWTTFNYNLKSGTEQYYNINYKNCPTTSDGYYQVVLYVEDGMVSFTNLKYNGLELKSTGGTAAKVRYNASGLLEEYNEETGEWVSVVNQETYVDYQLLSRQIRATRTVNPSAPDVPDASEPEASEPEASEPEASEPEASEPENEEPGDSESETEASVPMYRLYNANSGEHFYTGSAEEKNNLVAAGWKYEGVAWNAPVSSGDPVYRVYNPNSGDHHYTMSQQEVNDLVAAGWKYEGVAWNSAPADAIAQYRLYNPNAACGSHHYTSSMEERENLVALGWIYEGIGWYGLLK